jgi:hypothetical protein
VSDTTGRALDLCTMAQRLLDGLVAHYTAAGETLPSYRYIAAGETTAVPWDCTTGQVTVALQGVGFGPAEEAYPTNVQAGGASSVMDTRHAIFEVAVVRPLPTTSNVNGVPSAESLNTAGVQFMHDAGMISQALVVIAAELKQDMPRGSTIRPGIVDPRGPSGGLVGAAGMFYVSMIDLEAVT